VEAGHRLANRGSYCPALTQAISGVKHLKNWTFYNWMKDGYFSESQASGTVPDVPL